MRTREPLHFMHYVMGGAQTTARVNLWTNDHSRNTVSYLKGLRIQAFESLEALKMYYAIGASVSSLHRESIYRLSDILNEVS